MMGLTSSTKNCSMSATAVSTSVTTAVSIFWKMLVMGIPSVSGFKKERMRHKSQPHNEDHTYRVKGPNDFHRRNTLTFDRYAPCKDFGEGIADLIPYSRRSE